MEATEPRYRRLLRTGQRGEAVVVIAKADRGGGSNVGAGIFGWNVTIRVKFPDGGTADFDRYLEAWSVSGQLIAIGIYPGTLLPIRFDPAKPKRVESTPTRDKPNAIGASLTRRLRTTHP